MAGYIFNLDSIDALNKYIKSGVYSTKLPTPNGHWGIHHEGTLADYVTMKSGDNVYFFIQRKIYGIGKLVNIEDYDCKFLNYPDANIPKNFNYNNIKNKLLWDEGNYSVDQRWICVFKPDPYFFSNGIDMDDILSSNPSMFRMLRAFWKVSFIKVDDDENQALIDIILRTNKEHIGHPDDNSIIVSEYATYHNAIKNKITPDYYINCNDVLASCSNGTKLNHEMALESGILYQLCKREKNTINTFGEWDYLSHQVIASPFKPIDYMDKMDIFGYSYIKGFDKTKSEYLIIENKKDLATLQDVEQLMKYVDWVKDEYAYGDYSMIRAFLVAYQFTADAIQEHNQISERRYITGRRPARSSIWTNLRLIKYEYDINNKLIKFIPIHQL